MSDARNTVHLEVSCPRADRVAVVAVSAVAIVFDMALQGGPAGESLQYSNQSPVSYSRSEATSASGGGTVTAPAALNPRGFVGEWVDIFADGVDLGVISGQTSGAVSGANAPALATNGNAGSAGVCMRIPSGTFRPYYILPDDRFWGIVASGNGQARIVASSRPVP